MLKALRCNYRAHNVWIHKQKFSAKKLFTHKHILNVNTWLSLPNSQLLVLSKSQKCTPYLYYSVNSWYFCITFYKNFVKYLKNKQTLHFFNSFKTKSRSSQITSLNTSTLLRLL